MKEKIYIILIILVGMYKTSLSQEPIDLFIWAGQSNAQGWQGNANSYPNDSNNLDQSIRLNYTFINNYSSNGWITMQPQKGRFTPQGHFGPEVTFSRELKKAGYNPAIFKFCLGGSNLYGNWRAPGKGGFYDDMVNALNVAIQELKNQGHSVNIKGFIWIQGEGDGNNTANANAYEARLLTLINDLRDNVVNNNMLTIILGVDEQHSNVIAQPAIVNAHQNIAENDDNIKFTSMYSLPKADATHLTPAGLITHGIQIYNTFNLLLSEQKSYSSCAIEANGNKASIEKTSWGQSFKPNCSGTLSEVTFNSASEINSSFTVSISNGADCNANQLHSQTINSITNGENLVSISNPIYLNKEHTYYINISSDWDAVWKVQFNNSNQVIGSLRTSLNNQANSTCGWSFPNFDLGFSVLINGNLVGINNKQKELFKTHIYPNPTLDVVHVYLKNIKRVSVKVLNTEGVTIYNKNNINSLIHEIDLNYFPAGMYFVNVNYGGQQEYNKLILK